MSIPQQQDDGRYVMLQIMILFVRVCFVDVFQIHSIESLFFLLLRSIVPFLLLGMV